MAEDKQESSNLSYNDAWKQALSSNAMSFVQFIAHIPFLIFTMGMFIYHTYLSMVDSTTHEHVKGYYSEVPFTPHSAGSIFKNWFLRITEKTPESLLKMELRMREKISVHETKAALERKFDIKKSVLDTQQSDQKRRQQAHKVRLQQLFKKEILHPSGKPIEAEKRVELSEEIDSSSNGSLGSGDVGELEEDKSDSLYTKIKSRNYPLLQVKNPGATEYSKNEEVKGRNSIGSSSSSFLETNHDKGSVATFNQARGFRGLEQSEIAKQGAGDSDITSTIRGAFNQISSIVEAQEFRFGKNSILMREKSAGL